MNLLLEGAAFGLAFLLVIKLVTHEAIRKQLTNFLKVAFTGRILWLLLTAPAVGADGETVPSWKLVIDLLQSIDPVTFWTFILIGSAVRFGGVMASMYRWQLVLRGQGIELPFWHIFGSFLIGRVIGFFLPSTAGLDAYKLYDAARFSGRTVEVTAGTALEKVLGVTGIFLTYLVALPVGISIFGENATKVVVITVPMALGVITALLAILWFPGIVQWVIENTPIPAKARIQGIVMRLSQAAAAYRDKKALVLLLLSLSFLLHFSTAAMYYFIAIAVGATGDSLFWPIVFGSSIQIFATVIGPTIGGMGVREAAQVLTIGALIGKIKAGVSANLGFWVGEVPTLFGVFFWLARGKDYTPSYCRVNGVQVDYEAAAKQAVSLGLEDIEAREDSPAAEALPSLSARAFFSAGYGMGTGILAGILIGLTEAYVIAQGGFGADAQVLWYGPLAYSVVLGVLGFAGGLVLAILPMGFDEIRGWTPSLGMIALLVPMSLFITVFRLRRDVYLEQMPPMPVLAAVLGIAALVALILFFLGRRIFGSPIGILVRPIPALLLLVLVSVGGAFAARSAVPVTGAARTAPVVPAGLGDAPNVILVMVDTLRADHLSCYGHENKTPAICSLVNDGGSRFSAYAQASWTKPSAASLLTSLYPSSHGAMSKPSALPDSIETLAEVLKARGYSTGGIVSNINLAESFGFAQGYDEYHYLGPDYIAGAQESSSKLILYNLARVIFFKIKPGLRFGDFYQDSTVVNAVAFDWLTRHKDSRFFLFLHYMDPHDPYFEHPYNGKGIARVSNQHPDGELAEEMHRLYNGEIEYLDRNFAKLLDKLKTLGTYDDTVIALVSDHGEEFYEHEGWWHGMTLYEEQIHVPLLIKWKKGTAPLPEDATAGVSRVIDIAPTLIRQADAFVPSAMQGIDLTTPLAARAEKDGFAFSEEDHEGNVLRSLRNHEWKLIEANEGNPRGLEPKELYDMRMDPGETNNAYGTKNQRVIDAFTQQADAVETFAKSQSAGDGSSAELTASQEEALRALGYIE